MTRSLYLPIALALAVGIAACDSAGATGPMNAAGPGDSLDAVLTAAAGSTDSRTADQDDRDPDRRPGTSGVPLFDQLAEHITGFGGLYRVRPCAVVVVLTADGDREHAINVVRRAVMPLVERSCSHGLAVTAEQGLFTYVELRRFHAAARPLLRIDGVVRIHIDFKLNRLVVAVESRRAAQAVSDALPELGIPARAVVSDQV